jgi:alcohol dehydrogenase
MDTAKGCNFILTNGGSMRDYWGIGKARHAMLPLIAVPTTAGTGSEMQSFALISDEATHQKMACGDPKAAARVAVLDPELTLSQPRGVTACTGIDALAHALETAVTVRRTPWSLMLSREAFRNTFEAFPRVLSHPDDVEARSRMQLGAALAGMAIEASMLGAAHSAANPLTAHHGVIHGQAVGIALPWIIRHNAQDPVAAALYREHAHSVGLPDAGAIAGEIENYLALSGLKTGLRSLGVEESGLATLAEEAAAQWTARFNPRPVNVDTFLSLYASLL